MLNKAYCTHCKPRNWWYNQIARISISLHRFDFSFKLTNEIKKKIPKIATSFILLLRASCLFVLGVKYLIPRNTFGTPGTNWITCSHLRMIVIIAQTREAFFWPVECLHWMNTWVNVNPVGDMRHK